MFAKIRHFFWPVVGLGAVLLSGWLLYKELRNITLDRVIASFDAIPTSSWILAFCATLVAYGAIAEYDRIALKHLNKTISLPFVMLTSFTTYALSHNIGASVLSGALVRFRAYGSRGLTPPEVGILVGLASFTYMAGALVLGGAILTFRPDVLQRFFDLPDGIVRLVGLAMLGILGFYLLGSLLHFQPLKIGSFSLYYPRPEVVIRQLLIGPLDFIGGAAIIYFCLPAPSNPGFIVILGVFIISFTVALISHAPGGLGVLEFTFLMAIDDMDQASVLAALIAFRLFYLLLPLALAIVVVLLFERSQLGRTRAPQD